LTEPELFAAIRYLTATGQICDERRQEFILLSDVLGVSMLVDALNHKKQAGETQSTVLGPFYVEDAPEMPLGANIARDAPGTPLYCEGTISGADGLPLAGAVVDIWQSDSDGSTTCRRPPPGSTICVAGSAPDRTAAMASGRSCRRAIRSLLTVLSAGF
jgi:hydroxyquinol 1,2-dioxygenase